MPQSWQERLSAASTEAEVVDLARDFIAQFSPYEIAALPQLCRPIRLTDGNDITEYAFTLVRHRCDSGEEYDYAVHRLTNFFSNATARLSRILHDQSQRAKDSSERESA